MTTVEAVQFFKGKKALADALGIYPSAVSQWGDYPPPVRQFHIQTLSRGRLKAEKPKAA